MCARVIEGYNSNINKEFYMVEIAVPEFTPLQWVQFKMGTSQFIGQIQGARHDGIDWYYVITNPGGSPYQVKESDITDTVSVT